MLHDEEYTNIYTGEVLPATKAIEQYYSDKNHGCLDDWQDEWAKHLHGNAPAGTPYGFFRATKNNKRIIITL